MKNNLDTSNIKLAIFDIDDTLIKRGQTHIDPSALQAIAQLKEKGIEVMIATGRSFVFIQEAIKKEINPDFYITTNGACVLDKKRNPIYTSPMPTEEVNALITYAKKHQLGIAMKLLNTIDVYSDLHAFQTIYMQGSKLTHVLQDHTKEDQLYDDQEVYGIFIMGDEDLIRASSQLAPNGYYARAYGNAYDVYSIHAGKIKGIEHILQTLNLKWDQVISFGDADNDIDMLKKSAIGVAMGNANESVQSHSDFITKDIGDQGIAYAIQNLFQIKERYND